MFIVGEEMDCDEQLKLWLEGKPVHNYERDECCPDFSCCNPHLLASEEERKEFILAVNSGNLSAQIAMLGEFLGRLCSYISEGKSDVLVLGLEEFEDRYLDN